MNYDEIEVRCIENEILQDLKSSKISARLMKSAHSSVAARYTPKPEITNQILDGFDSRRLFTHLQFAVQGMRKVYRVTCRDARREPTPAILARLSGMDTLLDALRKEDAAAMVCYVRGLRFSCMGIALKNNEAMSDAEIASMSDVNWPSKYDGSIGRKLEVEIVTKDSVVDPAELASSSSQPVGSSWDAVRSLSCRPGDGGEMTSLPLLTSEEVHRLLSTILPGSKVKAEMVDVTRFKARYESDIMISVNFSLLCGSAGDAHFVGKMLRYHYLVGDHEAYYFMEVNRTLSQEEKERLDAEALIQNPAENPDPSPLSSPRSDASREPGKWKGRGVSKTDDNLSAFDLHAYPSDNEADELFMCEKCHTAVDGDYPSRSQKVWLRLQSRALWHPV